MNNDPLGTGNFIQGRMPGYQQRPTQQPKKKKSFWQDQISTLGSMGGAGGGAAIGATIGSVVPGLGTAIGGLAGALLGGAVGGGAGQRYENAIVGDDLNKDVLKEAALGGAFAVGPIRGANVLAKGGMAALKGAGTQGVQEAVERAVVEKPIRNMLGKGLTGASDNMAIRGIRPSKSQLNKFTNNHGEKMEAVLKRNNLVGKDVDEVNGVIGALDDQFGQIVAGTPSIPKLNVMNAIRSQADELKNAGPLDLAKAGDDLLAEADAVLAKYGDEVPATAVQQLKRQYDSLVNFTNRQSNPARTSVNERVANTLRETLRSSADDAGLSGAGMSLKQLGQESSKLKALRDLMEEQANLGRGTNFLGIGTLLGGTAGGVAGGVPGALATAAATKAINSSPAMRIGAKVTGNLGERLSKHSSGLTVAGILGREAAQGGSRGLAAELSAASQVPQEEELPPEADLASIYGGAEGETGDASVSQNPFGVTKEQVAQEMVLALQSGNTKAFGNLKDIYKMISDYEASNATSGIPGKPKTVEGQKAYNNALSGIKAVDELEGMLSKDGGLTWKSALPGGSVSDALLGASKYETALMTAADSMARLRTGAAMTKEETKNFKAMLPKAGDTPETIAYKLNNFRVYFNEVLNQPSGGLQPSSLEEAMIGN